MSRDFLSIDDLTPEELGGLLDLSARVKRSPDQYSERLRDLSVAMIFEKPSTRTRVSFEVAIASMSGHPVPLSPVLGAPRLGTRVRVAPPPGFEPIPQIVHRAEEIAEQTGGSVELGHDPMAAVTGADVLYTDVWASMGQEAEADERSLVFPAYRLDEKAVALAGADVIVMHCLPAHRGQEITDEG